MSAERVLVTGASGFIGRQTLGPLLARGSEVHAVSRTGGMEGAPSEVRWHAADLLEPVARRTLIDVVRPERLLHLAWDAEHGAYWTAPDNLAWTGASLALLREFAEAGGRRAVGVGTCAEYAWGASDPLVEDQSPLRPATLYGAAKHAVNLVGSQYAQMAEIEFAWARMFFVYGPHEHPDRLVSSIARRLVAGEPAPISRGVQRRDFLHVGDAGSALAALLDGSVEGAVNVASGTPVAVVEVARRLGELTRHPELVGVGALPDRDEPAVVAADVGRLRDEVGWRPAHSLERGLDDALRWWEASHR